MRLFAKIQNLPSKADEVANFQLVWEMRTRHSEASTKTPLDLPSEVAIQHRLIGRRNE